MWWIFSRSSHNANIAAKIGDIYLKVTVVPNGINLIARKYSIREIVPTTALVTSSSRSFPQRLMSFLKINGTVMNSVPAARKNAICHAEYSSRYLTTKFIRYIPFSELLTDGIHIVDR